MRFCYTYSSQILIKSRSVTVLLSLPDHKSEPKTGNIFMRAKFVGDFKACRRTHPGRMTRYLKNEIKLKKNRVKCSPFIA